MLIANLLVLVMMKMKAIWLLYTWADRKSTRLNSSHSQISYAVFCLKKKKITLISDRIHLDRVFTKSHLVFPFVHLLYYYSVLVRTWLILVYGLWLHVVHNVCSAGD